jgi:hypothetical protein
LKILSLSTIFYNWIVILLCISLFSAAIKFSVRLVETTESYRSINASLLQIPVPGCEEHYETRDRSDKYWECYARTTTITAYKYCGTVPMGRDRTDTEAVVDAELRWEN